MIPCIVLAYGDPDINIQSLKSLTAVEGDIKLDVMENPSQVAEEAFHKFARECISAGRIRRYIRYNSNISNNAFLTYLAAYAGEIAQSEFAIITDCDIIVPPDILAEQLNILSVHPEIVACGMRMDASRWPDSLSVKNIVAKSMRNEKADYVDTLTGLWFALIRSRDLLHLHDVIIKNRMRFVDGNLQYLSKVLLQKKWVATKRAIGRELTRERENYAGYKKTLEPEFAPFSPEKQRPSYAIWNHNKFSDYDVVTRDGIQRGAPPHLQDAVGRFRTGIETDATVQAIRRGEIINRIGRYSRKMPLSDSPPGVYFVPLPQETQNIKNGIPHFSDDKSIIFLRKGETPRPDPGLLKRIEIGPILQVLETHEALSVIPVLAAFLQDEGRLTGSIYNWESICQRYRTGTIVQRAIGRVGAITITQGTSPKECFDAYMQSVKVVFRREEIEELAQKLGFVVVFKDRSGLDKNPPMLRFSLVRSKRIA